MHVQPCQPRTPKSAALRQMILSVSLTVAAMIGGAPCAARAANAAAPDAAKPFLGSWALTIPGGAAGWLGVTEKDGQLKADLLWGGGSVLPLTTAKMDGDRLVLTRVNQFPKKSAAGKNATVTMTQTITARVSGDVIDLTTVTTDAAGKRGRQESFSGKRTPPLPPAPDLSKVKFGPPIVLFNGKDLTGWKVIATKNPSGWCVENGLLVNHAPQEPGKHKAYANLRTDQEFEDFNLTLETRVPKDGNSGIYLRGIYEVQVFDSYGKPLDCHNMGAVYSRICPTAAVEKPAGQWQTFDITFVDRHVTVILNGTKIIDNQPLLGCTGGALWSDQLRPGPIYLQGDHTSIEYRDIVLRPVVK